MTPAEFVDLKTLIESEGFYWQNDSNTGNNVLQFLKAGLPFDSTAGLELVRENILEQPVIRGTLESAFERSFFSFFRGYGHKQGQAYTLSRNHEHEPFGGCLTVQLWMRESEAIFHRRSHTAQIPAQPSSNNLLEVANVDLKDPIESEHVVMPNGGWALADPRCAFTIEKGFVILVVFATEALINIWQSQMIYPDIPTVRGLMREMESGGIRLNIKLEPIR